MEPRILAPQDVPRRPHLARRFRHAVRSGTCRATRPAVALAAILAIAAPAWAGSVLHLNLDELCRRADRIFRAEVTAVTPGSVIIGGRALPSTTYTLRVRETFKGDFDGDEVRLSMLGDLPARSHGSLMRLPLKLDLPVLERGRSYVLMTTKPGKSGLATTVGLRQGCFRIVGDGTDAVARNGIGNAGLFRGTPAAHAPGPIPYAELAALIRDSMARTTPVQTGSQATGWSR